MLKPLGEKGITILMIICIFKNIFFTVFIIKDSNKPESANEQMMHDLAPKNSCVTLQVQDEASVYLLGVIMERY